METKKKSMAVSNARSSGATVAERELVVARVFDAARELVFEAWTKSEHLMKWWGPKNFTVPFCTMDFRTGGAYRLCMRSPEGRDYWVRGVFRDISKPERIVFSWAHEEENGAAGHETVVTVLFEEQGEKTKLTLSQSVFESETIRDEHNVGWTECLERLAAYLARV